MVSCDSACISDTIPVVFLLEQTLRGIMERALGAEQQEEEDFLSSQGPLYPDTIIPMSQNTQEERGEEDEEEHSDTFIGFEEEEDMRQSVSDGSNPRTLGSSTWLGGGSSRFCHPE
ncbi:hypothetical protein AB205_0086490 [Aquarana catesbeiana]|uniref:Uncharacterized protein n=1 Tax=Aquarana catesbeiana TaxID=8400 RepID=A0A2G9S528_AQUCT|nr:hypothetical protein AB205_0086490 [Aquarana catesbeiana]